MLKGDYLANVIENIRSSQNAFGVSEQLLAVLDALLKQLKSSQKSKGTTHNSDKLDKKKLELYELRDACLSELRASQDKDPFLLEYLNSINKLLGECH